MKHEEDEEEEEEEEEEEGGGGRKEIIHSTESSHHHVSFPLPSPPHLLLSRPIHCFDPFSFPGIFFWEGGEAIWNLFLQSVKASNK